MYSATFHLRVACVSALNTITKHNITYPRFYGMCINVQTGVVSPAKCIDKLNTQPMMRLRNARHSHGSNRVRKIFFYTMTSCILFALKLLCITNTTHNQIEIHPFTYQRPWQGMDKILDAPDEWILHVI
jgi:hypothetical protein